MDEETDITQVVNTFTDSIEQAKGRSLTTEQLLSIEQACQHLETAIAVIQDLADRGLLRKDFATSIIHKATEACITAQTILCS